MDRSRMAVLALLLLMPLGAAAYDYPTVDRVRFVYECMKRQGGESWDNMYKCSCMIDHIASVLPYDTYVEADTYTRGFHAMGERGNEFRDPPQAKALRSQLQKVEAESARACLLDRKTER